MGQGGSASASAKPSSVSPAKRAKFTYVKVNA